MRQVFAKLALCERALRIVQGQGRSQALGVVGDGQEIQGPRTFRRHILLRGVSLLYAACTAGIIIVSPRANR